MTITPSLKELCEISGNPCVTMYLPMMTKGVETQQNPVRLKNHLAEAKKQLTAQGTAESEAAKLLKPIGDLADDTLFWQHTKKGLALFLAPDFFRMIHLPYEASESTFIDDHFHISGLLPMLRSEDDFFLLSLDEHHVRLYHGSLHDWEDVTPDDMPENVEAIARLDNPEQALQHHSGSQMGSSPQKSIFHAQGGGNERHEEDLHHYCNAISHVVQSKIGNGSKPLYLCASRKAGGYFRKVTHINNLEEVTLDTNPNALSERDLHQKAVELHHSKMRENHAKFFADAEEKLAKSGGTTDLATAVDAAREGRVSHIVLSEQQLALTSANDNSGTPPTSHPQIEALTRQTLLTGGKVVLADSEEQERLSTPAALFRY